MALVTLKAADGRTAMPAFTSAAALASLAPGGPAGGRLRRPGRALRRRRKGAELLVLDPGSEVTFVVRRPAVWALAQQHAWVPSYADEELAGRPWAEAAAGFPAVRNIELLPGGGVASTTADRRPCARRRRRARTAGGALP